MWNQLFGWLWKTPPEEPPQEKIARLMNSLHSPERSVHRNTDAIISRILANTSDYSTEFIVALLDALAQEPHPEHLDLTPRYILLLTHSGFGGGRYSPLQVAAQACLNNWQAREEERSQASTLLRAAERPEGKETLLRPASGNPPTKPDELLRASEAEAKES